MSAAVCYFSINNSNADDNGGDELNNFIVQSLALSVFKTFYVKVTSTVNQQ